MKMSLDSFRNEIYKMCLKITNITYIYIYVCVCVCVYRQLCQGKIFAYVKAKKKKTYRKNSSIFFLFLFIVIKKVGRKTVLYFFSEDLFFRSILPVILIQTLLSACEFTHTRYRKDEYGVCLSL